LDRGNESVLVWVGRLWRRDEVSRQFRIISHVIGCIHGEVAGVSHCHRCTLIAEVLGWIMLLTTFGQQEHFRTHFTQKGRRKHCTLFIILAICPIRSNAFQKADTRSWGKRDGEVLGKWCVEPECVRIASSEQNSSKDSARIALFGQIEDGGFQTSPKMLMQLTGCFRPSLRVVVVVLYPASHVFHMAHPTEPPKLTTIPG